jgi:hypothetical protein
MTPSTPKSSYHAYLIRLWSAHEQGQVVWRASLENPHTGERLAFTSLQRLFAFLQDQTALFTEDEEQWPILK